MKITTGLSITLAALLAVVPSVALLSAAGAETARMERAIPGGVAPEASLIGYGCGDDERTMFGQQEDEFPACARIQRVDQPEPMVLYVTMDEARAVQGHVYELNGGCRLLAPAGREGYLELRQVPCS